MLTELAMCNSAFQIIKKTIQNGREIFECGEAVSKFVSAKEELRERGTKRRNNIYHSLKGTNFGDLSSGKVVNRRACSDSHGGLGGY